MRSPHPLLQSPAVCVQGTEWEGGLEGGHESACSVNREECVGTVDAVKCVFELWLQDGASEESTKKDAWCNSPPRMPSGTQSP